MAEEKYLAEYEKSVAGNYLKRSRGVLYNVMTKGAADYTLLQEESGSVVLLDATDASAGVSITLPAVKAGCSYKFHVLEDTPSQIITIAAGSAIIFGNFHEAEVDTSDDGPGSSGATGVSNIIVGTGSKKGDRFELICDGTNWFLSYAQVQADGTITTS